MGIFTVEKETTGKTTKREPGGRARGRDLRAIMQDTGKEKEGQSKFMTWAKLKSRRCKESDDELVG